MLQKLHIENYAIIDELEIDFHKALNIITGETGAGKSIMLGAISLILGKRADSKVLLDKKSKCIVEAIFDNLSKETFQFLEEEGFDSDNELIIRREINTSGKSRAFINDTPTTLKNLERISENLIDLNRQFELLDIQQANFHLAMIDTSAGINELVEQYRTEYFIYRKKEAELKQLKATDDQAAKEYEFLKFQYQELEDLSLIKGEQKTMESSLETLSKSEDLINLAQKTEFVLSENEDSISDQIRNLAREWESLSSLNPIFKSIEEALVGIENEIEEIIALSNQARESIDADPTKKTELESRLNLIYSLLNKHRVKSEDDLLELYNNLGERLGGYNSRDEQISKLERFLNKIEKKLRVQAEAISSKRKKASSPLAKKILKILDSLGMGSSKIEVRQEDTSALTANGIDDIEIYFSANKGSELKTIKQVASGGELSRLMLAMKSTVANQMKLPTLIFDEIDTGVSGEVANKMGVLMRELGNKHQVIVITHSPQVSASAHKHFHIFKEEDNKRAFTRMKVLNTKERITEIAKMLSGSSPTDSALSNARELLDID